MITKLSHGNYVTHFEKEAAKFANLFDGILHKSFDGFWHIYFI